MKYGLLPRFSLSIFSVLLWAMVLNSRKHDLVAYLHIITFEDDIFRVADSTLDLEAGAMHVYNGFNT